MPANNSTKQNKTKLLFLVILLPIIILVFICSLVFGLAAENRWGSVNLIDELFQNNDNQLSDQTITATIKGNDDINLNLQIADSPKEHSQGLMYRHEMPENNGMIFVFDNNDYREFWMKNTYLSLDMAFLDENKQIINIFANTEPLDTEKTYPSTKPARYVIETNAGWFTENDVEEGDYFEFNID